MINFSILALEKKEPMDEKTVTNVMTLPPEICEFDILNALVTNFDSIYYVNLDANQVFPYKVSPAVYQLLRGSIHNAPGYEDIMKEYVLKTVLKEDQAHMLHETSITNLEKQFRKKHTYEHDYRILRNGKVQFCRAKFVDISTSEGLHQMVAGFSDISSEKQTELEHMAYVDPVTGGDNYESFKHKLSICGFSGYLISVDIHSFKIINSICGIEKGNETIQEIWNCISGCLDTNDLAGHITADQFVIYSYGDDKGAVINKLAHLEKQLSMLSAQLEIPKLLPYYGVSHYDPGQKIEGVYSEANFAKKQIRERQDINYQFYSHNDTLRILEEKKMEDAFLPSLESERFEIWYQPKYDPSNNALIGAEGLVRWRDPAGNLISPGKFIPLFERDGLIRLLDEYVFRKVCHQQMEWHKEGKTLVPVSINLSRASLYFDTVVDLYHSIVEEIGIIPELVPIEITESAAIDNANIKGLADKFHDNGFPLLVDDFGSGYSSLSTLNMKCFDTLKIDKSLIDYIGDFSGERLLDHTITLAKELGLHVTAEGVEQKEQVDFLKTMHCDSIQGFFYSKPLPENDFEALLLSE